MAQAAPGAPPNANPDRLRASSSRGRSASRNAERLEEAAGKVRAIGKRATL